jgi:hypothetical protein
MDKWEMKIHWLFTALLLLVLYACIMSSLRELRIQQQRTRDAVYTMSARTDSLLTQLNGARIWLWLPSIEEK